MGKVKGKRKGTEIRNGHASKVSKAVKGKGAKLVKGKKLKA